MFPYSWKSSGRGSATRGHTDTDVIAGPEALAGAVYRGIPGIKVAERYSLSSCNVGACVSADG